MPVEGVGEVPGVNPVYQVRPEAVNPTPPPESPPPPPEEPARQASPEEVAAAFGVGRNFSAEA
ncbi:MAG: hypothetical protein ACUVXI_07580 [bacterium]